MNVQEDSWNKCNHVVGVWVYQCDVIVSLCWSWVFTAVNQNISGPAHVIASSSPALAKWSFIYTINLKTCKCGCRFVCHLLSGKLTQQSFVWSVVGGDDRTQLRSSSHLHWGFPGGTVMLHLQLSFPCQRRLKPAICLTVVLVTGPSSGWGSGGCCSLFYKDTVTICDNNVIYMSYITFLHSEKEHHALPFFTMLHNRGAPSSEHCHIRAGKRFENIHKMLCAHGQGLEWRLIRSLMTMRRRNISCLCARPRISERPSDKRRESTQTKKEQKGSTDMGEGLCLWPHTRHTT